MTAYTGTAGGAGADESSANKELAKEQAGVLAAANEELARAEGGSNPLMTAGGLPPIFLAEDEGALLPGVASGVWAIVSG